MVFFVGRVRVWGEGLGFGFSGIWGVGFRNYCVGCRAWGGGLGLARNPIDINLFSIGQ